MNTTNFFSKEQQNQIIKSIEEAELNTSGEIRLHIENSCKIDPIKRAIEVFEKLEMHKTELKNGVLIYLAIKDKKLAIIGDKGINEIVPDKFWDEVKDLMLNDFKLNQFSSGLCKGILKTGEKLKEHFPHNPNDINELSNEISFGD
jgi:uncharacterized membrane protein